MERLADTLCLSILLLVKLPYPSNWGVTLQITFTIGYSHCHSKTCSFYSEHLQVGYYIIWSCLWTTSCLSWLSAWHPKSFCPEIPWPARKSIWGFKLTKVPRRVKLASSGKVAYNVVSHCLPIGWFACDNCLGHWKTILEIIPW